MLGVTASSSIGIQYGGSVETLCSVGEGVKIVWGF